MHTKTSYSGTRVCTVIVKGPVQQAARRDRSFRFGITDFLLYSRSLVCSFTSRRGDAL